jgi:hypothetical protein
MNNITEQNLLTSYETFTREQQRLLNELKNTTNDKKIKHLQKEINTVHTLELSLLKLINLKKHYEDKIKNL